MTVARTWAVALTGRRRAPGRGRGRPLEPDCPTSRSSGSPDKALGEAVQRVHNACANSGLPLPRRRLTVNLSPASLPKQGSGFDVAIAIAALATEVAMDAASVARDGAPRRAGTRRPAPAGARRASRGARGRARRASDASSCPAANRGRGRARRRDRGARSRQPRRSGRGWHGADVEVPDEEPVRSPMPVAASRAERSTSPTSSASERPSTRSSSRRPAATTCSCAGRRARARRCSRGGCPASCPISTTARRSRCASIRSLCRASPSTTLVAHAAVRGAAPQRERRGARRRRLAGRPSRRDRAGERGRAVPRRGGGVPGVGARRAASAARERRDRDPPRRLLGAFPARFQLVLATNPCPCGNYGVRGAACVCPPMAIRRYLGAAVRAAARPHRHRTAPHARLGRRSRASTAPGMTTAAAARARARRRVNGRRTACAGRRGDRNASVPGAWLREARLRRHRRSVDRSTRRSTAVRSRCAATTASCAWRGRSPTSPDRAQLDRR